MGSQRVWDVAFCHVPTLRVLGALSMFEKLVLTAPVRLLGGVFAQGFSIFHNFVGIARNH